MSNILYRIMDDGSVRVVRLPPCHALDAARLAAVAQDWRVVLAAPFKRWVMTIADYDLYRPGPLYNGGQKYEWVGATPFAPASQPTCYMLRRVEQDAALESPEEDSYSGFGDGTGSEPDADSHRNDERDSDTESNDGGHDSAASSDIDWESSSEATPDTTSYVTSAAPAAPTTAAPRRELVLDEDYDAPEDVAAVYEEAAIITRFLARCRRL